MKAKRERSSVVLLIACAISAYAFLEFARYIAVRGVLVKGAHNALALASKVSGLESNISGINAQEVKCPVKTGSSIRDLNYCSFVIARAKVLEQATSLALDTLVNKHDNPETPQRENKASVQFEPFRLENGKLVDAALIRPGDSYDLVRKEGTVTYSHPQYPPSKVTSTTNISDLMRNFPIIIRMQVRIEPLLPFPFVDAYTLTADATGFREVMHVGAFQTTPRTLLDHDIK